MLITVIRLLMLAVSLSWLLIYFRGGAALVRDNRRAANRASAGGVWLASLICTSAAGMVIYLAQILICLGAVRTAAWAGQTWIALLGALLICGGIAAEYWIRGRYLGPYWSGSVELKEGHQIVKDGPYRAVRHPLYAFNFVIYAGATLVFPVWWNWLACGAVMLGYVVMTAYEDAFLAENLDGYREYQRQTRYRMVPGIW